jgi:hypothetical protein
MIKAMKKLFLLLSLFCVTAIVNAQNKDVTKFLGMRVDGTKSEMLGKLKIKGFRPTSFDSEILVGEFNGYEVEAYVVTNKGRVWRIMLMDVVGRNEANIKLRYNNLCDQFRNNEKYFSFPERDQKIPEDENISYNMNVKNKRYQAVFYQMPEDLSKYSIEDFSGLSKESKADFLAMILGTNLIEKKSVWFTIGEIRGDYYIIMYYDNRYNMANGEDL